MVRLVSLAQKIPFGYVFTAYSVSGSFGLAMGILARQNTNNGSAKLGTYCIKCFCAGERGICSILTGQPSYAIRASVNGLKIIATCVTQNCWHFSDNWPQRCQEWLYKLRVSLATNSTVNSAVQQLLSLKAWHALNAAVSGDGDALCNFPLMHLSSV